MSSPEEQYLEAGGMFCPYCGSNDLSASEIQADGKSAWCDIQCLSCAEEWKDIYTLTGVEMQKPAKVRMVLTIDVTYDLNGASPSSMEYQLKHASQFLAGEGLLSGDGPATVDSWEAKVVEVKE